MKVAILAGGLGTRLSEETNLKPKPMVEIGGKPILWHIMKSYAEYGFKDFVIALGYKGEVIKDFFINYRQHTNDIKVDLSSGEVAVYGRDGDDWKVHLLDTGLHTQTGGRIRKLSQFIGNETFMLTYGDGVADIDYNKLLEFHHSNGKLATVTAVRPPARFGGIAFEGNRVVHFMEKPQSGEGWINGGFFVLEPGAVDYVTHENVIWEREPMEQLAANGEMVAYKHETFWQCMDTLRDVRLLEEMWNDGNTPWKNW